MAAPKENHGLESLPLVSFWESLRFKSAGTRFSSVIEKRILSACWHGEPVRHGQRATLIALQRNFLCRHDVACDEMTLGRKAPTSKRTAGAVELVNVHRGAVTNPVSLSAVAAGDLKIALGVILRDLLRR